MVGQAFNESSTKGLSDVKILIKPDRMISASQLCRAGRNPLARVLLRDVWVENLGCWSSCCTIWVVLESRVGGVDWWVLVDGAVGFLMGRLCLERAGWK